MGNLVGTKSDGPSGLSQAESDAIELYSGGDYIAMNSQLRNTGSPATEDVPMNFDEMDAFLNQVQNVVVRKNTMELAVAGLNKLPTFKGITYRGLTTEPGGYFDVIQPGAMIVDLAFQSASPSMHGVEHFLSKQLGGTKHIYFMIHTRSAANIMQFSLFPEEGEVLFKPGAKFQVKDVWRHRAGKVPPNAPPEAQMILHENEGEFKNEHQLKVIELVEV